MLADFIPYCFKLAAFKLAAVGSDSSVGSSLRGAKRRSNRLAPLCLLLIGGCSSLIEGTSQEIAVSTSPPGALCGLYREDAKIGEINAPGTLLVRKSKYDIIVVCRKDGYQQAIKLDHSGMAATTVASMVLGAGVGWAVDSVSGADNKYDSPISLTLIPAEAKAASPQAAAPARTGEATLPDRLARATPPDE